MEGATQSALALYIHWPFCLSKCPYCDFNSHVRDRIDVEGFGRALRAELASEAAIVGARDLGSIFFGGGTPSLMPPGLVADLIADASRLFRPASDLEVTLEANPTSIEAAKLRDFRAAGVNRVSIGVQSFRPDALAFLGRQHSATQAAEALTLARGIFPRMSFDLIYGRPAQTLADWERELDLAFDLAVDHLSLYQLTIEPGTRFEQLHRQGLIALPDADDAALLYRRTVDRMAAVGLTAYEVSNFARPGGESRHNLTYWRYGDYAGIGPGAHGRLTVANTLQATRRHRAPEVWAARVDRGEDGAVERVAIPPVDRAREALLMGLRLAEGVSAATFFARTGLVLDDAIDPEIVAAAAEEGYLDMADARLVLTLEGRLRIDALLPRLVL